MRVLYDLVIVGGGAAGLTAALYASRSGLDCIVLDPFLGSGSTLIACEQTHRICYGIELDEKFVDVIVNRYIEQCGSDADVFVIRDDMKISYQQLCRGGQYNETDDLP